MARAGRGGLAFLLIDGIGDVSIPELGNRTPLEAAQCPNLDAIAGPSLFARAKEFRRASGLRPIPPLHTNELEFQLCISATGVSAI